MPHCWAAKTTREASKTRTSNDLIKTADFESEQTVNSLRKSTPPALGCRRGPRVEGERRAALPGRLLRRVWLGAKFIQFGLDGGQDSTTLGITGQGPHLAMQA